MTPEQERNFQSYGIDAVNGLISRAEKDHVRISDAVTEFIAGFRKAWLEVKKELDGKGYSP